MISTRSSPITRLFYEYQTLWDGGVWLLQLEEETMILCLVTLRHTWELMRIL